MGTVSQRYHARKRGEATYRLIRYADDFVICVAGDRQHAEALVTETAHVLRPLGLTLSKEKTRVTHIKDGIDFLGWRIKRDLGRRGRPGIFLFPSRRSVWSVMGKVKEITRSGTNQSLDQILHRLNPVLRGWCNYFRSGQSSRTFQYLSHYTCGNLSKTLCSTDESVKCRRRSEHAIGGGGWVAGGVWRAADRGRTRRSGRPRRDLGEIPRFRGAGTCAAVGG